jgi:hypothetical protein
VTAQDEASMDPIELAVYERLRHLGCTVPVDPADPEDCANVAVEAVAAARRAVLHHRPDAERVRVVDYWSQPGRMPTRFDVRFLLAALADETAARQQAEADLAGARRALAKVEGWLADTRAKLATLPEWRCPSCGAITRARMADQEEQR